MGHFVKREMKCWDDEISDPSFVALGDKPFPTRFIDDVEGYYYYSFGTRSDHRSGEIKEVWYKRREL
jgi:hypothetical protein